MIRIDVFPQALGSRADIEVATMVPVVIAFQPVSFESMSLWHGNLMPEIHFIRPRDIRPIHSSSSQGRGERKPIVCDI